MFSQKNYAQKHNEPKQIYVLDLKILARATFGLLSVISFGVKNSREKAQKMLGKWRKKELLMYNSKTFDAKWSENFNSFVSQNAVKRNQTDWTTTTANELKSIELIRSALGAIQPHSIHSNTIFNTAVP